MENVTAFDEIPEETQDYAFQFLEGEYDGKEGGPIIKDRGNNIEITYIDMSDLAIENEKIVEKEGLGLQLATSRPTKDKVREVAEEKGFTTD